MLKYSVSLQTGCVSLAVMLSIAVRAALGSATRFLGDAGCLLYKQSNLTLKSVAADGGRRQSILDFRFEILDWRLEILDWRLEIGDWRLEIGDLRLEIFDLTKLLPGNADGICLRQSILDFRFEILDWRLEI